MYLALQLDLFLIAVWIVPCGLLATTDGIAAQLQAMQDAPFR